jgi:hypothetical protein
MRSQWKRVGLGCIIGLALLAFPPARSEAQTTRHEAPVPLLAYQQRQIVQGRECSQRVGPFATQDRAWQQWRTARGQGYAVSNGVTPCYEFGTRGYCFCVLSVLRQGTVTIPDIAVSAGLPVGLWAFEGAPLEPKLGLTLSRDTEALRDRPVQRRDERQASMRAKAPTDAVKGCCRWRPEAEPSGLKMKSRPSRPFLEGQGQEIASERRDVYVTSVSQTAPQPAEVCTIFMIMMTTMCWII